MHSQFMLPIRQTLQDEFEDELLQVSWLFLATAQNLTILLILITAISSFALTLHL